MKDAILLELAKCWDDDAKTIGEIATPKTEDEKIQASLKLGERAAKRECADIIRTLVSVFSCEPL